jgi:hypothetical protein
MEQEAGRQEAGRPKKSPLPVTSFEPDHSLNLKRMEGGMISLVSSFVMMRSLAFLAIRKAVTFLEIMSAKEVKAGGSDNKEHHSGAGLARVGWHCISFLQCRWEIGLSR